MAVSLIIAISLPITNNYVEPLAFACSLANATPLFAHSEEMEILNNLGWESNPQPPAFSVTIMPLHHYWPQINIIIFIYLTSRCIPHTAG